MSVNPPTPGTGPVTSSTTSPSESVPTPTPVKPKPKTRSNAVASQPVQPTTIQTRASNKQKHPGLAQTALDTTRWTSEDVQAEKEQKRIATETAERERINARDRLAAFEDDAQKAQDHYKKTFAQPNGDMSAKTAAKKPSTPTTVATAPKRGPKSSAPSTAVAQKTTLLAERSKLDRLFRDSGDYPDADGDTENPQEVQDTEQPENNSDNCGEKPGRKKKTTRSEVSHKRTVSASTPIITKTPTSTPEVSIPKKRKNNTQSSGAAKSKKPNVSGTGVAPVEGRLKKKANTSKKGTSNAVGDAMLQEGQSIGFDDNKEADTRERVSTSTLMVPVKIQNKPIKLAVGREARSDGKKFSTRHLPAFIRENKGDRRILYPLAKEAVGHVHSWGPVKSKAVQSIVDRGWGEGRVEIP
ncbi:hypothetical protein AAF712_016203, partial [Marasmius tenuissimus]